MPKVTTVYLFTNRTTMIFDETGQQVLDLQTAVANTSTPSHEEYRIRELLVRLLEDKPEIYLVRWPAAGEAETWQTPILLDEFASLIGLGHWYFHERTKEEEDYNA